ncbi:MAG: DUF4382 domain-containing protein [Dehalococcoidia bacterium]|nr:DUF4382 domain-containing protein [Dehalococcoidia bacterium]
MKNDNGNLENNLSRLLKAANQPVSPRSDFKQQLLSRLREETGGSPTRLPGRIWARPFLWAPAAAAVALALLLVIFATPPGGATGTLEIRVTDAPANREISAVDVTISMVQVRKKGSAGDGEKGWLTIVKEPKNFDLLKIRNVEEFLGDREIESGQYGQIRMDVKTIRVTVDGKETDTGVNLPGGKLKLAGGFEVKPGERTVITLDFDADKSLVFTGEGKIIFKPVVKLIVKSTKQGLQP